VYGDSVNDETLALRARLQRAHLAPAWLGLPEQTALHLLQVQGSMTARALGLPLCAPDWQIAQVLDALEQRGYVTHDHPEDPARRRWSCTEIGGAAVRTLLADRSAGQLRYAQLLARLTSGEQQRAREHWGDLLRAYEALQAEKLQGKPRLRS
jgi:DNA-binding MarR family transcriptional regulator